MVELCDTTRIRKAAVLAFFGAVRAAMRRLPEARLAFEQLAVRLDLLASLEMPVSRDPEVVELIETLGAMSLDGFSWVLEEICDILSCMRVDCGSGREGDNGGGGAGEGG